MPAALVILVPLAAGLLIWSWWILTRLVEQRRLQRRRYNQFIAFRSENPVVIVGNVQPDAVRRHIAGLARFLADARAYRPRLSIDGDLNYAEIQFEMPFSLVRNPSEEPGPEPARWLVACGSLTIPEGAQMAQIYEQLDELGEFPFREPTVEFCPPIAPAMPEPAQLPEPEYHVVSLVDGGRVDQEDSVLAQAYAPELRRVSALTRQADDLCARYEELLDEAAAATIDVAAHLAAETQRLIEVRSGVAEQFRQAKWKYEDDSRSGIGWIQDIHRRYLDQSKDGVECHFDLGLQTLQLPIPPSYPWSVSYDPMQKSLLVVQRVPTLAEIVVLSEDGEEAGRDEAEWLVSRFIPLVLLGIGRYIARSDPMNHVGLVVVEAWSRFYDVASESLQNAVVAELRTTKGRLANIDLRTTDPLDAFRKLRGQVTCSKDGIVASNVPVRAHPRRTRSQIAAPVVRRNKPDARRTFEHPTW
ncbi:MAG: hypothetical protein IT537_20000 [Hyphomicrobiales bacterium]|nr:hypothetical protein [Hyphomicrobiales bacterium]